MQYTSYLKILLPCAFALLAICAAHSVSHAQTTCPVVVSNVKLNGGTNVAIAEPGSTVKLTLDYLLSNLTTCSNCLVQIVVGLDQTALGCAYNSIPPACPASTTGEFALDVKAPTAPGVYKIYYNHHLQFNCNDAQKQYANVPRIEIATIVVCGAAYVSNVKLNGGTNVAIAEPGSTVKLTLDYLLSNPANCPNCFAQIAVGLDQTVLGCAYNGGPAACAAITAGKFSLDVKVPTAPGVYKIYYNHHLQRSCENAQKQYATVPRIEIATIVVCGAAYVSNVKLNGGTDVAIAEPGSTVKLTLDYLLSNPANCPNCFAQIAVGLDQTVLGCAYNGGPAACAAITAGKFSLDVKVPTAPGVYKIYYNHHLQFNCENAQKQYATVPRIEIAAVTVGTTSTYDGSFARSLQVSPNPTQSGTFTIAIDEAREKQLLLRIVDMSGRVLYTQDLGAASGEYRREISAPQLPAGLYSVQLIGDQRTASKLLVNLTQ